MRILFIGEVPSVLQKGTAILCEEGYSVEMADNPDYARFRCANWDYDLIIRDVSPGVYGAEAFEPELPRRNSETPILTIISRESAENGFGEGDSPPRQLMFTPFTRSELLARVRSLLRHPRTTDAPSIAIGPIVIDRLQRTVTVNRNDVALTSKEYSLLEFLAIHRGAVVSRTEIYDHLFEFDDPTLANLLDVYVCNIRRKLGGGVITTRRGAGYLIEESSHLAPQDESRSGNAP